MLVRVERANQNERQRTVSTHFWWANRQNSLNDFRSFSSVAFLVNRWFSIKINHYGIGNLINLQLKFSLKCTDLKPIFRLSNRRLFLVLKKPRKISKQTHLSTSTGTPHHAFIYLDSIHT